MKEETPSKSIVIFFDKKGKRYEFSNNPENCVVVKLKQEYYNPPIAYRDGEVIVIPREIAERIECEVLGEWIELRDKKNKE